MKKILAMLLSLVMVVTFMPTMAFADSLTPGDGKYMVEVLAEPDGGTIEASGDAQGGQNEWNGFIQHLYNTGDEVTINITPKTNPEYSLDSITVIKADINHEISDTTYFSNPDAGEGQQGFNDLGVSSSDGVYTFIVSSDGGNIEDIAIIPNFFNEVNEIRKSVEEGRYAYCSSDADTFKGKLATEIYNKFFTERGDLFADVNALKSVLTVTYENDDQGIADAGQCSYELQIGEFTANGIVDILNSQYDVVILCNRDDDEPIFQVVEGEDGTTSRRVIFNYEWKNNIEVYGNGASICDRQENNFDQHTLCKINQDGSGISGGLEFSLFVHQACGVYEDERMRDVVQEGQYAYYPGTGTDDEKIAEIKGKLANEIYSNYFSKDDTNVDDELIAAIGYFRSEQDVKDHLDVSIDVDHFNYSLDIVPEVVEDTENDIEHVDAVVAEGEVGSIQENEFFICYKDANEDDSKELVTYSGTDDVDVELEFTNEEEITIYGNGVKVVQALEISWDRVVYLVKNSNDETFFLNICNTMGIEQPGDGQQQFTYIVYGDKEELVDHPGQTVDIGNVEIDFAGKNDGNCINNEKNIDSSYKITTFHKVFIPDSVDEVTFTLTPPTSCDSYVSTADAAANKIDSNEFTLSSSDFDESVIIDFRPQSDETDHKVSSIVKHTFNGWQGVQVSINGQKVDNSNGDASTKKSYTASVTHREHVNGLDDTKVRIEFRFEEELSHIKIDNKNGGSLACDQDVEWATPADRLKTYTDYGYHYTVDIPKSNTGVYEITTTMGQRNEEEILVSGFGWNTGDSNPNKPAENSVDGGKISLKKAVYKGDSIEVLSADSDNPETTELITINGMVDDGYVLYDPDEGINKLKSGSAFSWWGQIDDVNGDFGRSDVEPNVPCTYGSAFFPAGTELTIVLTPDYGKQLVEFRPMGADFREIPESSPSAEAGVSTYTFTVPNGRLCLGAKFRSVSDEVTLGDENTTVRGAGISVEQGKTPVDSGTLNMRVNQVEPEPTSENAVAAVNITMDNVFYAGEREIHDEWTQSKSELDDPVTITLDVDGINSGDSIKVMREHGGQTGQISAKVNNLGEVEFKSDKFSTYTIIKTTGGGGGNQPSADEQAFAETKTSAKASCDALREANKDSKYPHISKLIDKAEADIDALQFDSSKSLAENQASVTAIVEKLKADIKAQKTLDKKSSTKELKVKKVKVTQKSLKAYKGHKIKVTFKRAKVDGKNITSYQIYRKTGKSDTYERIKTLTAKKSTVTYTNTKLKKGKTYYYKVRGVVTLPNKSKAYTKWSAVKSIKCK